jgi:amino acid transporter
MTNPEKKKKKEKKTKPLCTYKHHKSLFNKKPKQGLTRPNTNTPDSYDSPFHLAEECTNASLASPRAIFLTSAVGGTVGFFLQLVVAYTVISIPDVLSSPLGQPFAAYLVQILPQKIVLAILALTIIAGFFMGQGCMIAASRVTFAYARDDCFPFSRVWKRVNRHTLTPVNAVWFNTCIGCLLLLLILGGSLAAGAMFSIAAIAAFVAFTIPIFIRVFFVADRFRPGPWHLGRWSALVGGTACGFVLLMVPVLCLPAVVGGNLSPKSMNWTCLVYGGPMAMVLGWWVLSARKWFKGPKVNVEHLMLGRQRDESHVIVGEEVMEQQGGGGDAMVGLGAKAGEAAKDVRGMSG